MDRFEIAIQQPKLITASIEEIKQNLRFAMILVGVRAATIDAMAEEEKMILIEFLREKYPYHTAAEIKIAFTKAAAYELDIKDVNHYENFTCEYIGRIMSAYRKWASEMNHQLRNRQMDLDKYRSLPPHEKYNGLELVDTYYQEFLKDEFNQSLATDLAWETINSKFKIESTDEERLKTVERAKNKILSDYENILLGLSSKTSFIYGNIKQKKNDLEKLPIERACTDAQVNKTAKIIAMVDWFEKRKEEGIKSILEFKL